MGHPIAFIIFIILHMGLSDIVESPKKEEISLQGVYPDSSSRCGDSLDSISGTISYKSFQTALPNERCVWTIRSPNATSFIVNVDSVDSSGLLISGFVRRGSPVHISTSKPETVAVDNSNVLVITFYSTSTTFKGFSLRYYRISSSGSNYTASNLSEDIIIPANNGLAKFPSSSRSTYDNDELSIILITPLSEVYSSQRKTEVIYIRSGLEGQTCNDIITVYTFNSGGSTANKWLSLGRMCGGVDSEIISSSDIIMLVFESDYSSRSSGFQLYTRSIVV